MRMPGTPLLLLAACGMLATAPRAAAQQPVLAGAPIHQEADVPASPARVSAALMTTKDFAAFSGMPATIDEKVGGAFTIFDGHIMGRTLEVVPGKRVVQAWRTTDWPAGVWSIVRFDLVARGSGTHIVFNQTGFPEGERASLSAGWKSHYWDPLAKLIH